METMIIYFSAKHIIIKQIKEKHTIPAQELEVEHRQEDNRTDDPWQKPRQKGFLLFRQVLEQRLPHGYLQVEESVWKVMMTEYVTYPPVPGIRKIKKMRRL